MSKRMSLPWCVVLLSQLYSLALTQRCDVRSTYQLQEERHQECGSQCIGFSSCVGQIDPAVSSLMQVSTHVHQMKNRTLASQPVLKEDGGGAAQRPLLGLLKESLALRLRNVSDKSVHFVGVLGLVTTPIVIAVLFMFFFEKAPPESNAEGSRGCPCCPWPTPELPVAKGSSRRAPFLDAGKEKNINDPHELRSDALPHQLSKAPQGGWEETNDPYESRSDTLRHHLDKAPCGGWEDQIIAGQCETRSDALRHQLSKARSPRSSHLDSAPILPITTSRSTAAIHACAQHTAAPVLTYTPEILALPKELLEPFTVERESEGSMFSMHGAKLKPGAQHEALPIYRGQRRMLEVLVAEEEGGNRKGIMLETAQHPSIFITQLDTNMAFSPTPDGSRPFVKIWNPNDPYGGRDANYIVVENKNANVYSVIPVSNGVRQEPWYRVVVAGTTADFYNENNHLDGKMQINAPHRQEECTYVFSIAYMVDASLIMAASIAILKLTNVWDMKHAASYM